MLSKWLRGGHSRHCREWLSTPHLDSQGPNEGFPAPATPLLLSWECLRKFSHLSEKKLTWKSVLHSVEMKNDKGQPWQLNISLSKCICNFSHHTFSMKPMKNFFKEMKIFNSIFHQLFEVLPEVSVYPTVQTSIAKAFENWEYHHNLALIIQYLPPKDTEFFWITTKLLLSRITFT